MIRKTLKDIKKATFSLLVPSLNPKENGMPIPNGTCFFISSEGYILTANHVIDQFNNSQFVLERPGEQWNDIGAMVHEVSVIRQWPQFDMTLLKANYEKNADKACFYGLSGFPFIEIDFNHQEDGAPVYSFGFPLPEYFCQDSGDIRIGHVGLCPRTTSAMISSSIEMSMMIRTPNDPKKYVLDKALNYGNSGGPIILQENGKVFAICARFQPMHVPQPPNGSSSVLMPSLYGVVMSISNNKDELLKIGAINCHT
ncbi:MAG: serine protease [Candidatus Margulisiibacteriota bacterium]